MLKNKVEISLIVSKDFTTRNGDPVTAIRRISDKLTVVRTYLPGKKNPDGTYGDSDGWEVQINGQTAIETTIDQGSHIDVEGFLSPRSYTTADGQKRTYTALVARKITQTEYDQQHQGGATGSVAIGPNAGQAAPAPATPAPATSAPAPAAMPDYSDELPFS